MSLATRDVCSKLVLLSTVCALSCGESQVTQDAEIRRDASAADAGGRSDAAPPGDGGDVDVDGGDVDGGPPPTAASACYAFDQPPPSVLRALPKKVFGFYYPIFPISIENDPPSEDFWNDWLRPDARGGEYQSIGGLMRDRPLPRPPWPDEDWRQRDFETEVRRAIAVGLDGFIYEHPYRTSSDARNNQLPAMLAAALAVDPDFAIMLSPDFPTESGASTDGLVATIAAVAEHPSIYRLDDGRVVLASFAPQRQPVSFWEGLRERLAEMGIDVAFWPLLNPLPPTESAHAGWNELVDAYGSWGGRAVSSADSLGRWSDEAHRRGRGWMAPVAFQEVRHKIPDGRWHAESSNSGALRAQFEAAIEHDADAVALVTWTDYTESWMSASVERGYAVSDLVAYYTIWFKTGAPPPIVRDALYYFHRNQLTDAPYDTSLQTAGAMEIRNSGPAEDMVELLAFTTAPGQLVITQGRDVQTMDAPAGMTSFRVPIVPGTTPAFELRRGGEVIEALESHTLIRSSVVYQDMMYHAGGGRDCTRPD